MLKVMRLQPVKLLHTLRLYSRHSTSN